MGESHVSIVGLAILAGGAVFFVALPAVVIVMLFSRGRSGRDE